jgi:hypothetical protein
MPIKALRLAASSRRAREALACGSRLNNYAFSHTSEHFPHKHFRSFYAKDSQCPIIQMLFPSLGFGKIFASLPPGHILCL